MAGIPIGENIYQLESSDKVIFDISEKALKQSNMLQQLMSNLKLNEKTPEARGVIPVEKARGEILRMVVEWCEQHKDDAPITSESTDREVAIPEWDAKFLEIDGNLLSDLTNTSNYLEIPKLQDMCCKTAANMGKGKLAEELRKICMIDSDEEEEKDKDGAAYEEQETDEEEGPGPTPR